MRRSYGQKVVDLANAGGQSGRGDQPADAPARDGVGLAGAADRDGPLRHAWQSRQADVAAAVHEVLVDLIGDGDRVVLDAKVRDQLELGLRVDLPGRVVRRVDDDGPR